MRPCQVLVTGGLECEGCGEVYLDILREYTTWITILVILPTLGKPRKLHDTGFRILFILHLLDHSFEFV